jgi:hypothetical protein
LRIIELSMATPYFDTKYVAAALRMTRRIATILIVTRCARTVNTAMKRHRPANR